MSSTTTTTTTPKTIAFFGATNGCGLAALRKALSAGHVCIALARNPVKLTSQFPAAAHPNLVVRQGNAHSIADVTACLVAPSSQGQSPRLVDEICFSIGGPVDLKTLSMDDPDVCKKGMDALLRALTQLRETQGLSGRPLVVVVSTTGISSHARDVPMLFVPFYHIALKVPHEDKKVVEKMLVESGERYVLVRPSLLTDGADEGKNIRVGLEDVNKGRISKAVGYVISREAVGRWMYENLMEREGDEFVNRAVSITW